MDARKLIRTQGPTLAVEVGVNLLVPYLVYSYAAPHVGEVKALLASSAPPILWSGVEFARHRRLDAMSILVLAGIVLSLLAFLGGGGAKMLQLREKLVTGVIGVVFLVSAAIGRPLIYQLARAGSLRRGATGEADRMAALKNDAMFRRSMTLMTLVWGFGLVADVAVAVVMVFALSVKQYLIAGPIEGYVFMGALSLWTFWYARRAKRRGEAFRAAKAGHEATRRGGMQRSDGPGVAIGAAIDNEGDLVPSGLKLRCAEPKGGLRASGAVSNT